MLGGETNEFADACDMSFTIRHDLMQLTNTYVPLTILTDSLTLFKVLHNTSVMTEKRLKVDISAAREAYENKEIDFIGWIPSEKSIANGLTKVTHCPALTRFLRLSHVDMEIQTAIDCRIEKISISSDDLNPHKQKYGECESNQLHTDTKKSMKSDTWSDIELQQIMWAAECELML